MQKYRLIYLISSSLFCRNIHAPWRFLHGHFLRPVGSFKSLATRRCLVCPCCSSHCDPRTSLVWCVHPGQHRPHVSWSPAQVVASVSRGHLVITHGHVCRAATKPEEVFQDLNTPFSPTCCRRHKIFWRPWTYPQITFQNLPLSHSRLSVLKVRLWTIPFKGFPRYTAQGVE